MAHRSVSLSKIDISLGILWCDVEGQAESGPPVSEAK